MYYSQYPYNKYILHINTEVTNYGSNTSSNRIMKTINQLKIDLYSSH